MDNFKSTTKLIVQIFGTETSPKVTEESLPQYRRYILDHFDRKTVLTGCDCFRWEEFYLLGPGYQQEYEELKKTRPSYADEYRMIDIMEDVFENA